MAMTLRLSPAEDESLARLAREFGISKNSAALQAIDLAGPRPSHTEFVHESTTRLLHRYAALLGRLAEA